MNLPRHLKRHEYRAIALDALDKVSRLRAFTEAESIGLERCPWEEPKPQLNVGWPMFRDQAA